MKKIFLLLVGGLMYSQSYSQTLWSEDFSSATPPALPTGWSSINIDNNVVVTNLSTYSFNTSGAVTHNINGTAGNVAAMTSWYTPAGTADDYLITPAFTPTTGMFLGFDVTSMSASPYQESYEVKVSTTGGATAASFTTTLYSNSAENSTFTSRIIDLSAYAGQSIKIAFHDNSTDKLGIIFDNVFVKKMPNNSAVLKSIFPTLGDAYCYDNIGASKTISCTVKNIGVTAMTSFNIKYQAGASTPVTQAVTGANIAYGTSTKYTFTTPYNIATLGSTPVNVWVELAGDTTHTDDTLKTAFVGVSAKPAKAVVMEEPTGTWCGYCVRGIVYMDSIHKAHPNDVIPISVHNADPMTVAAYDAGVGTMISGFPSLLVDRKAVLDPSNAFTAYTRYTTDFGFASVSSTATTSGANVSVVATITPFINMTGDYRLALAVTEDRVHPSNGADTSASAANNSWSQHNYYSNQQSGGSAGILAGGGYNFNLLPTVIPAATMYFDFVARDIVGGFNGATGSLPTTMTNGTPYNYTMNYTIPSTSNGAKMRYAVLLINNNVTPPVILNGTMSTVYPLGLSNIVKSNTIEAIAYPNPTKNNLFIDINLKELSNINYFVTDINGKVVLEKTLNNLNINDNTIEINTSNLIAGIYSINLTTKEGTFTSKFVKE